MILTILDYDQTGCSSGLSLLLMLEVLKVVKEFYVSAGGLLMAIILFYLGGLTIWKILNDFLYEQTVIACFARVVLLLSADRQLLYMVRVREHQWKYRTWYIPDLPIWNALQYSVQLTVSSDISCAILTEPDYRYTVLIATSFLEKEVRRCNK